MDHFASSKRNFDFSFFKFWKSKRLFDVWYGPADSNELLLKIANMDVSDPSGRAEELAKFPLSHNARLQRINFLLSTGQMDAAKNAVAIGVALYPESFILVTKFLRLWDSELEDDVKIAIQGRLRPLPGYDRI